MTSLPAKMVIVAFISSAISEEFDTPSGVSLREHGGIGRRTGLKIRWELSCGGSSPPAPIG